MAIDPLPKNVRKRRVFYIPGYDPIHPRRYRELYRTESAKQAHISEYEITQTPKNGDGPYGWHTAADMDGSRVTADIEVLLWSDIVRDSMATSIPATYAQLIRTAWIYISTGALWRLMKMRKGPVIAALYPIGFLIAQFVIAVLIGWVAARLSGAVIAPLIGNASLVTSAALGGLVIWLVLGWFKRVDNRVFAYYLMHDYAFSARWWGGNPPELDVRMQEFADIIANAMADDVDEVLVVGHSSGAHLAVSILADLLRSKRLSSTGPELNFLSLGHVVPMMSFLPQADKLRADLAYLSAQDRIAWVDVTAPGDGCSFALCDPVAVSGVTPADKRWPLVMSAAFSQTLQPETWKALRWRFFRLHFQYLCAFDRPGDYDYFRITSGPTSLRARYDGRRPSKSRIETPLSKYTSMSS